MSETEQMRIANEALALMARRTQDGFAMFLCLEAALVLAVTRLVATEREVPGSAGLAKESVDRLVASMNEALAHASRRVN